MATAIFTHPVPILALGIALGFRRIPPRLFWVAVLFTMLPDLDAIGYWRGVRYADLFGHRGFSHSLLFALLCGGLGWLAAPLLRCRRWLAFVLLFFAVASHIALDAATNGGLGVAAFWPYSETRYFFPWRPIQVSPMSPRAFISGHGISERGLKVLYSELRWVWLPFITLAFAARFLLFRRRR
jgi:inner membrane protein